MKTKTLKTKTVLVVEDLPMFQEKCKRKLEHVAEVIIAGTIIEAYKFIVNTDYKIDAIILDMNVPLDRHSMGQTTLLMPFINRHRVGVPVFAASAEERNNLKLLGLGCVPTDKMTAIPHCLKYLLGS